MFSCSLYKTSDELITRLRRSVIMYDGSPAYVEDIDGKNIILFNIKDNKTVSVPSTDSALSLNMPELGYVNSPKGCVFLMRRPIRLYKQGISQENISARGSRIDFPDLLRSTYFYDMLTNKYPTLESVVGKSTTYTNPFLKDLDVNIKAFHKTLAVKGNVLYRKGQEVGIIREDKTIRLNEEYTYLREDIEECLNECK